MSEGFHEDLNERKLVEKKLLSYANLGSWKRNGDCSLEMPSSDFSNIIHDSAVL